MLTTTSIQQAWRHLLHTLSWPHTLATHSFATPNSLTLATQQTGSTEEELAEVVTAAAPLSLRTLLTLVTHFLSLFLLFLTPFHSTQTGSTEEELAEVVTAAVKEKQTSGQGRPVAWDGQTMGGPGLRTQVAAIQVCVLVVGVLEGERLCV